MDEILVPMQKAMIPQHYSLNFGNIFINLDNKKKKEKENEIKTNAQKYFKMTTAYQFFNNNFILIKITFKEVLH